MIATGTDIKPLEIVMFMRSVKSPGFFEQMKGRGVRVISDTEFVARGFHPMVCAAQCEFARLNFPTFASSSRNARFSIHAPNILSCAPDCPAIATGKSQLRKMPALLR
jgi:hypothetical protein